MGSFLDDTEAVVHCVRAQYDGGGEVVEVG